MTVMLLHVNNYEARDYVIGHVLVLEVFSVNMLTLSNIMTINFSLSTHRTLTCVHAACGLQAVRTGPAMFPGWMT